MSKFELFEEELQETSVLFKVLSNPARLSILRYLSETKVCISGDISDELPLSRTTVHQHLTELKKTGFIKGEIQGAKTNYCLNNEQIKNNKQKIIQFLEGISCSGNNKC